MKNGIRVCDLTLCLLLLLRACHLRLCLDPDGADLDLALPPAPGYGVLDETYFFAHNETRIAIARGLAPTRATSGHRQFPDRHSVEHQRWSPWDDPLLQHLQIFSGRTWYSTDSPDEVRLDLLAHDGVAFWSHVEFGHQFFIISPSYERRQPRIQRVTDASPDVDRFVEVLVKIRVAGFEVLGEGVYCPITGTMHLVGCTHELEIPREALAFEAGVSYVWSSEGDVLNVTDFESESSSWRCRMKVDHPFGISDYENTDTNFNNRRCQGGGVPYYTKSSGVCDLSVTLQYPPLSIRWNTERVLSLAIRSTRREDDPLFFHPVERSVFFPYPNHYYENGSQATLETWGRMILLLLGIACVGLQIRHGRNNEEALPFISLAMLGIQIANHVSQLAIFKDLQIHQFAGDRRNKYLSLGESPEDLNYYITMTFHEYVPYQAMATASIFLYVWIFHRVGDRRRIMQLRVRQGKPGAHPPPSDRQLVFATLSILCVAGSLGITFYSPDSNIFRIFAMEGAPGATDGSRNLGPAMPYGFYDDNRFVSPNVAELSFEQWRFVNRLTGLAVSLFLVPQLLGNWRWKRWPGRPLSAWFYVGVPFLQSLPQAFIVATHFQLLPIFSWYDPYYDSLFGFYENPTPWWQMGVLLSSAILVAAVHLQFVTTSASASCQHLPSTAGVSNGEQTWADEL